MAASAFQDRGLTKPMQSMAAQTDVEMAKEEPGQTMSTGLQANADRVLFKEIAAFFHSGMVVELTGGAQDVEAA